MPDKVRAFVRQKETESGRHQLTDRIEAARSSGPEEGLQLGEGELDRIEIGTVGREKAEVGPGLLDRGAHLGLLVHRQVVHHDDVAAAQRGDQDLFDIGAERDRVDRPVEHGRRAQLGGAQRRDDRVSLPVATGRVIGDARPARTPPVAPEQIGRDARFVEEDILTGVVQRQALAPLSARGGDISATLFGCVYGFF
jgi:hypothetical protein